MAVVQGMLGLSIVVFGVLLTVALQPTGAYDPLDPDGNIIVKWDIMQWTGDGYTATVNIYNNQQFRQIQSWKLGWQWAKEEIIYSTVGARATDQGDCTGYPYPPPHSCLRAPTMMDLVPGVPYSQQVANCCRNGFLSAQAQDPANSVSSFQLTVGYSGNTNVSIKIPQKLTLRTPGPGYTCSDLKKVAPTKFPPLDGKRFTQAYLTWNATCSYSQYLAQKAPTCCVGLSAFYSDDIVGCPDCACSCSPNPTKTGINVVPGTNSTCISTDTDDKNLPALQSGSILNPLNLYCTNDMCPIKIHWHLKDSYPTHWTANLIVTNRNFEQNYSDWNVAVQHPNLANLTEASSFIYKPLTRYGNAVNDAGMFWGVKNVNDVLIAAGDVQTEVTFAKDSQFALKQGWGFPTRIYFNGDECVVPDPKDYPKESPT